MNKIRIIWKTNQKDKKYGYLRLSERLSESKKTKVISLGLPPIHERHFDKKKQRVKNTLPDFEKFNYVIEETLSKYQSHKKSKFLSDTKKTLRLFVEEHLMNDAKSEGTKQKYLNILKLLELYKKDCEGNDILYFKDIDEEFIRGWKNWLKEVRGNLDNSISYKTKTFKSFINKAIKQNYYFYNPNPFNNIENKITPTKVDFLDEQQINSILYGKIYDVIKSGKRKGLKRDENSRYKQELNINDIRNFFVFSLFNFGVRASDLMTLRFNNFYINGDEIRLKKYMLKTKHPINHIITYKPLLILLNYVPKKFIPKELEETINLIREINLKLGTFNLYSEKRKKIDFKYFYENLSVEINLSNHAIKLLNDSNIINHNKLKISIHEFNLIYKKIRTKKINNYRNFIKLSPYNPKNSIDDVKLKRMLDEKVKEDEELKYLDEVRVILEEKSSILVKKFSNKLQHTYLNLYKEMTEIIKKINCDDEYKYHFVFPLLRNEDFKNITDERGFERMSKRQYNSLVGRRCYYNNLLKIMGQQLGIPNLTTHIARHSYTSLMLKMFPEINIYDLSKSLGHTQIKTTEGYIQNFKSTRLDDMGKKFSDSFGGMI